MLEKLQDQGIDPPALLNRPECSTWIGSYVNAYQRLSRTRRVTMEGDWLPIQLSEVKAFIDIFPGIYDIETFVDIITLTDMETLSSRSKKAQK